MQLNGHPHLPDQVYEQVPAQHPPTSIFMLQIVNDTKSVPFVHLLAIKNPCTPPSNQKALIFGKLCKICQPFFHFRPREMELSKFTANCAKSAQFAHPCCESRKIHAICTNFPRFSVPMGKIVKIHDVRIPLYFCRFHAVHTGL